MLRYELPQHEEPVKSGFWKKHGWWLIPLIVVDMVILAWWLRHDTEPVNSDEPVIAEPTAITDPISELPPAPAGLSFGYPTAQQQLLDTNTPGIYMPTASGRPESAMYGSVRSSKTGASFHEGLDIAPMNRDRKQMPTDFVLAAADGRVAYFNRIAGNSNYGKYVVLIHDDPMGEIYTLYAHMADVEKSLRTGAPVTKGQTIGLMGNSASTGIPVGRAHLHFEVGIINNRNFHRWFKAQKLKPDHGNHHGHNLTGMHPLDVFRWQELNGLFNMGLYLDQLPPAFTVVLRTTRIPDYFIRYPSRWQGNTETTGVMVMDVSEGGIPIRGRPATPEERTALGSKRNHVLSVDVATIGRNGLHLVARKQGNWILGKNGERWLEIMTYH